MASIYTVNNKNYTIFDTDDIFHIIQKECSPELVDILREIITDLKEQADYTSQKIYTDIDCYESSLEEYSSMCCEVNEINQKLIDYIEDTKKMDRHYILERLKDIHYELNSVG